VHDLLLGRNTITLVLPNWLEAEEENGDEHSDSENSDDDDGEAQSPPTALVGSLYTCHLPRGLSSL
jgi:hypothetical protein